MSIDSQTTTRYRWDYRTPRGFSDIVLFSDGQSLTGLYFVSSRRFPNDLPNRQKQYIPIFRETCQWLDIYFTGHQPDFTPRYVIPDITPFQAEVHEEMRSIAFGDTRSYGNIAMSIARKHHIAKMSAQAVGNAVGKNPICIIVPCHRVMGSGGNLTGYGGGMDNKIALLALEGHDTATLHRPSVRN